MGFYALGDDVQFVPLNNEMIKYSGVVEVHAIDLRGEEPLYSIRTKDADRIILKVTAEELQNITTTKASTTRKK